MALEEIVVRARRVDVRPGFGRPQFGGGARGREFTEGRARARARPPPKQPQLLDEIVVKGKRVAKVLTRGSGLLFAADVGARIVGAISQQRLDEAGRLAVRPVPPKPDTPVRTIQQPITEIIVTAKRPALARPMPVPAIPRRRAPRRSPSPERRPWRPRRPKPPPAPVVPAPQPPPRRAPRRVTPIPPLRWPMNPNLPVPQTPNLPGRGPVPTLPRPGIFPIQPGGLPNVPTRPLPLAPTVPSPFTPTRTQPAPRPTPRLVPPLPGIAPGPVPGILPFAPGTPGLAPLADPAALTGLQPSVVTSPVSVAQVVPLPALQHAAAQRCPKEKDKPRDKCFKKLIQERKFPRWDKVYEWQEIDCLTGRPK